jgi:hypothetical protein
MLRRQQSRLNIELGDAMHAYELLAERKGYTNKHRKMAQQFDGIAVPMPEPPTLKPARQLAAYAKRPVRGYVPASRRALVARLYHTEAVYAPSGASSRPHFFARNDASMRIGESFLSEDIEVGPEARRLARLAAKRVVNDVQLSPEKAQVLKWINAKENQEARGGPAFEQEPAQRARRGR